MLSEDEYKIIFEHLSDALKEVEKEVIRRIMKNKETIEKKLKSFKRMRDNGEISNETYEKLKGLSLEV